MNWQDYMNIELKNSKKQRQLMTKISLNSTHKNREKWIKQLKEITPVDEIEYVLFILNIS